MASGVIKYCPDCGEMVETVWKFSLERCVKCKKALDENPINMKVFVPLGTAELNRRQVINMKNLGMLDG
jgi:DNA-directed RNA polymerase subunit M/transcription elongation factor TFIIS